MKKICLFSLFAVCLLALQGCGNNSSEKSSGFVCVANDSVKLYMEPNEQSSILFTVVDEGNFESVNYTWYNDLETKTTDVGYDVPYFAMKGTVLEVVEDGGDWLRVRMTANHSPYIQKKHTRSLTPMPVTDEVIKDSWIKVVKSGKYKDYCWYFDEMNSMYFVGKIEGDRFVFTKFVETIMESDSNVDGGFKIEQEPGYLPVVKYSDELKADDEFVTYLDLNKLSEEQFAKFYATMDDCAENPKVVVFFDEQDQYGNRLTYFSM